VQTEGGPRKREGHRSEKEVGAYLGYRNRNYRGGSKVVTMEPFYWITGVLFCGFVNTHSYELGLHPRSGGRWARLLVSRLGSANGDDKMRLDIPDSLSR
jgi:hypothetical protein